MVIDPEEYERLIRVEADRIMEGNQTAMLSDKYDAPEFAEQYRELAKKLEHRDLHIKAYTKVRDSDGRYATNKSGTFKKHWTSDWEKP
jgi:hypothetical protein